MMVEYMFRRQRGMFDNISNIGQGSKNKPIRTVIKVYVKLPNLCSIPYMVSSVKILLSKANTLKYDPTDDKIVYKKIPVERYENGDIVVAKGGICRLLYL